jgi:hypothetical protein
MLRDLYQRLQFGFDLQTTANVFIEGFALHARNLIDFFWKNLPPKAKDAVGRHFTDESYSPFNDVDPTRNDGYAKINKQISHVTYDRVDKNEDKLGPEDRKMLFDMIESEIQNFTNHVRAPYKELWQQAALARKVMPALGSDRFVYSIGAAGPIMATVTTSASTTSTVSFGS